MCVCLFHIQHATSSLDQSLRYGQDSVYSKLQQTTLNEFQSIIVSARNNKQLEMLLEKKLNFSPMFVESALRRAMASKKLGLLKHTLEVNKLFPADCSLKVTDELLLQFVQKAITKHDQDSLECLLAYITTANLPSTESCLQNYAILAAHVGFLDAVLHLCSNFPSCLKQTDQGHSILLAVICSSSPEAYHIVADLLRLGVYPNVQEPCGNTALHHAVSLGKTEIVKLLLSSGACANFPNVKNERPIDLSRDTAVTCLLENYQSPHMSEVSLYYASKEGNMDAVKRMLNSGVPVDSVWIQGQTALSGAARRGERQMVEFLLSKGASPFPKGNVWPQLPVYHALDGGNPQIACRLISYVDLEYNNMNDSMRKHIRRQLIYVLQYCACMGPVSIADLILTSHYNINPNAVFNRDNQAPLHQACQHGRLDMVKLLINHGLDPCLPSRICCNTPFHYACFYGQTHVARYLLSAFPQQVSIDCENKQQETPLYCVLNGRLSSNETGFTRESGVIFLISQGAKLVKPGKTKCELAHFNLNYASAHWECIPFHTQKLIMVLRDEMQPYSLANLARFTVRASLSKPIGEDVIDSLNLPYRLTNYILLKDWFPTI